MFSDGVAADDEKDPSRRPGRDGLGGRRWFRSTLRWIRTHWADPLFRNSYLLILNTGVLTISGFLFWFIAARMVPAHQLGLATATVGAITLLAMVSRLGLDVSLMQFLPGLSRDRGQRLLNSALIVTIVASIVGAAIFLLGVPLWSPQLGLIRSRPVYLLGFTAITCAWGVSGLLDAVFTARRQAGFVLAKNSLFGFSRLILVVILANVLGASGIVLAMGAALVVAIIAAFAGGVPRAEPGYVPQAAFTSEGLETVTTASATNYAVGLMMAAPLSIGSLIVLHRWGPSPAAVFYILWLFGTMSMIVPSVLGRTSLVEMVHRDRQMPRIGKTPLILTMLVAVGGLFGAVVLMPALGPEYASLSWLAFVPFTIAAWPALYLHLHLALLRAQDRNWELLTATVATVGSFMILLSWVELAAEAIGWLWLGSVTGGTLISIGLNRLLSDRLLRAPVEG